MTIYSLFELDDSQIRTIFRQDYRICFRLSQMRSKEEEYLVQVLKICLIETGKEKLFDYLCFIYRELLNNAKKANLKRVFFEENKMNIADEESYQEGMQRFKRLDSEKIEQYSLGIKKKGLYIDTKIAVEDNYFILSVQNNVALHEKESAIINHKMKNAKKFKTIQEATRTVLTNPEGAGLGIIITILMLKNLGLTGKELTIESQAEKTMSALKFPVSFITLEQHETINQFLLDEIDNIPQFPDHIVALQEKLNDPEIDIKELSDLILKDPSLTAEIIRYSNSAYISSALRISTVVEAIKMIGLKGLKYILFSYATKTILSERYDLNRLLELFKHSYLTASAAFYLAREYNLRKILDTIYVSGILHDLGKIIITGINPEIIYKINDLCHIKDIPIRIIEELTLGYSHQIIGALLATKWHFPGNLIASIRYHHHPIDCAVEDRESVYCTYLADIITHIDERSQIKTAFTEIYADVRLFFQLHTLSQFEDLVDNIKQQLETNLKELDQF